MFCDKREQNKKITRDGSRESCWADPQDPIKKAWDAFVQDSKPD
jgi:hypothetical protein